MQSLLLSHLLHIQMLHSHHACLPLRQDLIVLISPHFDPFFELEYNSLESQGGLAIPFPDDHK